MRHSVRRWLFSAGALAVVGASACAQTGTASAAPATLASHQAPVKAAKTYVPPTKDLYFGDSGAAVKSVQKRLKQLGYYPGPTDGVYGNDLEEAVWAFKGTQGLPMNAYSNSIITYAFRRALVHPKLPYTKYPKGGPGRVEVNQTEQVLVLYKHNKPHLILHVSSGGGYKFCDPPPNESSCGYAITPDGKYTALSYLPGWIKVPLGTMYNPVFFIGRDYAIHGDIPVPWYPASHGCVRIWMDAATWFHKEVTAGGRDATHIYVYGVAPYQPSIVG